MTLLNVEHKELLDMLFNTELKKWSFILLYYSIDVKLLFNGLFYVSPATLIILIF